MTRGAVHSEVDAARSRADMASIAYGRAQERHDAIQRDVAEKKGLLLVFPATDTAETVRAKQKESSDLDGLLSLAVDDLNKAYVSHLRAQARSEAMTDLLIAFLSRDGEEPV